MYMYVRVYMYSTCIMIFTDFSRLACTALFNCYVHVHVRMYTYMYMYVRMYTCTCMYVYMYMSTFPPSHYMYSSLNIIVIICS